jgi:hypothetical protein
MGNGVTGCNLGPVHGIGGLSEAPEVVSTNMKIALFIEYSAVINCSEFCIQVQLNSFSPDENI